MCTPDSRLTPRDVDILLDRRAHHLVGGTVQTGIDHVHSGVAQRTRHHLDPAVVAVEADLRQQDADPAASSSRRPIERRAVTRER